MNGLSRIMVSKSARQSSFPFFPLRRGLSFSAVFLLRDLPVLSSGKTQQEKGNKRANPALRGKKMGV